MATRVMYSTAGALSFSVGRKQYSCNTKGFVIVEEEHVHHGRVHGFRVATDAEAKLHGPHEEITPDQIGSMTRPQLIAFLQARKVKDIPARIGPMRQMVLEIADHESDQAAGSVEPDDADKSQDEKKAAAESGEADAAQPAEGK